MYMSWARHLPRSMTPGHVGQLDTQHSFVGVSNSHVHPCKTLRTKNTRKQDDHKIAPHICAQVLILYSSWQQEGQADTLHAFTKPPTMVIEGCERLWSTCRNAASPPYIYGQVSNTMQVFTKVNCTWSNQVGRSPRNRSPWLSDHSRATLKLFPTLNSS